MGKTNETAKKIKKMKKNEKKTCGKRFPKLNYSMWGFETNK